MIDLATTKFDIADYLDREEMIADYLNTVLEDGDSSDLIVAIGHIAKSIEVYLVFQSFQYRFGLENLD